MEKGTNTQFYIVKIRAGIIVLVLVAGQNRITFTHNPANSMSRHITLVAKAVLAAKYFPTTLSPRHFYGQHIKMFFNWHSSAIFMASDTTNVQTQLLLVTGLQRPHGFSTFSAENIALINNNNLGLQ